MYCEEIRRRYVEPTKISERITEGIYVIPAGELISKNMLRSGYSHATEPTRGIHKRRQSSVP